MPHPSRSPIALAAQLPPLPIATLCLFLLAVCLAAPGCVRDRQAVSTMGQVLEKDIPRSVAVLPVRFMPRSNATSHSRPPSQEDLDFVADLARGVLHNQLAGKGYQPQLPAAVDRVMDERGADWAQASPKELCRALDVQGVVYLEVEDWTMVSAAAVENFAFTARVRMVDAGGRDVGSWTDSADKMKVSVPTSLLGVAGTLLGALFSDAPQKQFRHVVYDWGWRIAQAMPDCAGGRTLPEIRLVDSNADAGPFGAGGMIAVRVVAEPDLTGVFSLGDLRRDIPLRPMGNGTYEGVYMVREGDAARGALLAVRMARGNGAARDWVEAASPLVIDGVPPQPPVAVVADARREGMHLAWNLPGGEEVVAFVVERNDTPVGAFTALGRVERTEYDDAAVAQGATWYYRVRSVDRAGNVSPPEAPLAAAMPRFEEVALAGPLTGELGAGNYRVEADAEVPQGGVLTLLPGARLAFGQGARLTVRGRLAAHGGLGGTDARDAATRPGAPVRLVGAAWRGVLVPEEGQADLAGVVFEGCAPCLESRGALRVAGMMAKGRGVGQGEGDGSGGTPIGAADGAADGAEAGAGDGAGDGLILAGNGGYAVRDAQLSGWARALAVRGGEGSVTGCTLTGNRVGVAYASGKMTISHNNIHGNGLNIDAAQPLAVAGNFMGGANEAEARVSDEVLLRSVLDAPYPLGREVRLVADEDMAPETVEKRLNALKQGGIDAFNARKYGDAHGLLRQALRLKADRDVYLYLAYAQLELGEVASMERTLARGIEAFPYDFRLRQAYVRHLLRIGEPDKAVAAAEKASHMDPGNVNVQFLLEYAREAAAQAHGDGAAAPAAPTPAAPTPPAPAPDGAAPDSPASPPDAPHAE
ncbi:MAG: hypothetical protein AB7E47_08600 [Desulfovibrionaceae bacterium]